MAEPPSARRLRSLARASTRPAGPAGTAYHAPRLGAGVLPALQHLHAVDEHVVDSRRQLLRLFERRMVLDRRRIEHDDVAVIAGPQEPALTNSEVRRRQRAQPPD